jgi:hypothetical protein
MDDTIADEIGWEQKRGRWRSFSPGGCHPLRWRPEASTEESAMDEEQGERSFTVSDKRFSARRESGERPSERSPAAASTERSPEAQPHKAEQRATAAEEINFASFLISLGTQAFMHLGDIPNPMTQQREKDLPAAKQMIDILGILEGKTKGNLAADEERLLQQLLLDLRLRYVRETGQ